MQRAQPYCGENSEPGRHTTESLTSNPELENSQGQTEKSRAVTSRSVNRQKADMLGNKAFSISTTASSHSGWSIDKSGNIERADRKWPGVPKLVVRGS